MASVEEKACCEQAETSEKISYNCQHYPLVVATWVGDPCVETVRAFNRWLDSALSRAYRVQQPLVLINDSRRSGMMGEAARQAMAEAMDMRDPDLIQMLLTTYSVITSGVVRGVFNAVLGLARETDKVETCKTMDEALAKGRALLEQQGHLQRPQALATEARSA